tara:strand:- start:130 stop:759 length:630 start_codon:yes stop_codon:yes gene_type:complete
MKELVEIQYQLKAPKNQFNGFGKYKYRSCEDILEGLKGLLSEHKCYVTLSDSIELIGNLTVTKSTATITNSEGLTVSVNAYAGVDPNKKGMDIAQTFGSSSSYARKYALNGLFAIDDTKDSDTQDNTPSTKTSAKSTGTATNTPAKPKDKPTLDLTSQSYTNAYTAYKGATSNDKRNNVKQSIMKAYKNANEVLNKLEEDYKKHLASKK